MRKIVGRTWLILGLLLLTATGAFADTQAYKLQADGLTCPFCAYGIEKKLSAIEGVEMLDIDIESGSVNYKANTEANDFEFGDVARLDASLQYRLWPPSLKSGVPGFLYGVLEADFIHQDKNRSGGVKDPNSGGTRLFLVPGLQYVTKRWIVEAAVQLPIVQDLNGTALENDYIVRAGFRFNF